MKTIQKTPRQARRRAGMDKARLRRESAEEEREDGAI